MSTISASKAKREAKKAAKAKEGKLKTKRLTKKEKEKLAQQGDVESATDQINKLKLQQDKDGLSDRVVTGVLDSLVTSRDIKLSSVSLLFHGKVLLQDSNVELNHENTQFQNTLISTY
ncbi:unnamed protein product [Ambrosiozyma monospora]|uniref:Unnamed protein product n=1 Tax=Ambrosiozyma monospora TaxID=43982 RepID=A0ACB5U0Z9_AMBMO|nr:unnamed protein product [Ambrosiozyma monospora]